MTTIGNRRRLQLDLQCDDVTPIDEYQYLNHWYDEYAMPDVLELDECDEVRQIWNAFGSLLYDEMIK